jgi:amino acid adenylation domain-containing protein
VVEAAPPAAHTRLDQSIVGCFEMHAVSHPGRLAIGSDSGELTYGELNALANSRARALRQVEVRPEEPVATLLEQGSAFIAAMLGVLKAGGCCVPLDPGNPPGRNLQMLHESGARVLVTNAGHLGLAETLAAGCIEVLNVDCITPDGDFIPDATVGPDSLACILFTSGSTGKPKGVMHDHRTLVHNAMRHREAFRITPSDRQTLLYTCSVYGGIRDIFNALLSGASLHTFNVKKRGVEPLAEWLLRSRITIYCSVTTVFRQLAATLTSREQFPDLRLIKLGGEASHRSDVELFRAHFPSTCLLHCGLGSTETGVVRHFFVDRHTRLEGDAVPLGYPIADIEVLLLDEQGTPVAQGEIGEIVVRSQFISRGYWQRPDLNERIFGSGPHDPRVRTYRTGDLGVLRADGCLEHRGRKDGQVKIRGNRVEIAEIETALRSLAGVAHAVVVVRRDQREENYLAAYVVARGGRLSISELRRGIAERLPEHAVPATFVELDSMPQTPNGKIDRQGLPAPDTTRPELEQTYVAPRSALEERLAALWSNLLGIERVGVQDDFFELGGNSLMAVRLMSKIRADHGMMLPLAVLFQARTIAALADVIARGHELSSWSPLVPIRPQGRRTPLFCVHPGGGNVLGYQEFIAQLHPDQPVYGIQAYGVVEGQTPHTSVHQMALRYIQAMREVQPSGPYYLGGESFGGLVAYEMACQLLQGGERVAFLFVGDVWPKTIRPLRYFASCLTYPFTLTLRDWSSILQRKVLRGRESRRAVKRYVYADSLHRANSLAHRRAAEDFVPRRYPGIVTLFRARAQDHRTRRMQHYFGGPEMGWNNSAAEVEVHWMPDVHREMMHGPNALGFAQTLQACIDRARAVEEADITPANISSVADANALDVGRRLTSATNPA